MLYKCVYANTCKKTPFHTVLNLLIVIAFLKKKNPELMESLRNQNHKEESEPESLSSL